MNRRKKSSRLIAVFLAVLTIFFDSTHIDTYGISVHNQLVTQ